VKYQNVPSYFIIGLNFINAINTKSANIFHFSLLIILNYVKQNLSIICESASAIFCRNSQMYYTGAILLMLKLSKELKVQECDANEV